MIDSAMKNRHIGEHDLNSRSSRSHCLTEINISISTNNTIDKNNDHHDVHYNDNDNENGNHNHQDSDDDDVDDGGDANINDDDDYV